MSLRRRVVRTLSNRIVQFFICGAALFLTSPRSADVRSVHITAARIENVRAEAAARGGIRGLDETAQTRDRVVEDEILVREARRLGLDRDDAIVRQRLVQRVLFLAEDVGGASRPPSELELRSFFETRRQQYRVEPRSSFIHVFGTSCDRVRAVQGAVHEFSVSHPAEVPPIGDAFLLRRSVVATMKEIRASYGDGFTAALRQQPPGVWFGPIASPYGCHLVEVLHHETARDASFEDVRGELPLDWLIAKREEAVGAFVKRAFTRYEVDIDGREITALTPIRRTAVHAQSSSED